MVNRGALIHQSFMAMVFRILVCMFGGVGVHRSVKDWMFFAKCDLLFSDQQA